jgi:hypothetical protein
MAPYPLYLLRETCMNSSECVSLRGIEPSWHVCVLQGYRTRMACMCPSGVSNPHDNVTMYMSFRVHGSLSQFFFPEPLHSLDTTLCIHTYIYTSTHIDTHTYTHTYTHAYMHTYKSIHIYTHIDTHTYTHAYTHAYMHTYKSIHIYTHIDTHTYIHAQIHMRSVTLACIHAYIHSYMHTCIHTCTACC